MNENDTRTNLLSYMLYLLTCWVILSPTLCYHIDLSLIM